MKRSDWNSFEDFERDWHKKFVEEHPEQLGPEQTLYNNGQFDEIPYALWEEME